MAATISAPLAKHIQQLNKIRQAVPALRKGQYSMEGCSGKFSFKRRYTDANTDSYALVTIQGNSTFTGVLNGTYTEVGGKRYRSVTNVGPRPTFMQNKFAVETNLIGYEGGSLLGETASVEFYRYLRPIKKYASAEELVARIKKDKEWTDL